MACTTRVTISSDAFGAKPHNIDATVKRTTAPRKVRRRPTRSASRPPGTNSAANTIVYALSTHDSPDGLTELKSALMAGNATKRIVVSRNTANTARLVDVSTIHGLRAGAAEPGSAMDA